MNEKWYRIEEYPAYEINEECKIRNIRNKRFVDDRRYSTNNDVYVNLKDKLGCYQRASLKRIVADTFLGGPHDDCYVDIIDEDPRNIRPDNLRWRPMDPYVMEYIPRVTQRIRVVETGEIFDSAYDCMEKLGITLKDAQRCLGNPKLICRRLYHLELIDN